MNATIAAGFFELTSRQDLSPELAAMDLQQARAALALRVASPRRT